MGGEGSMHIIKLLRSQMLLILLLSISVEASADMFDWEIESGYRTGGIPTIYGWNYCYDIAFIDDILKIDVDIMLIGSDPGTTLKDRWETGMETMWSTTRFSVPIAFNIDWVTSNPDQTVTVKTGTGQSNMRAWHIIPSWGISYAEELAAHEFGHMLGLWDEYKGGAVNPTTGLTGTGGLMETLNGSTLDSYYNPFLNWYDGKLAASTPVPEPTNILLFGTGLAGLAAIGIRRKRN